MAESIDLIKFFKQANNGEREIFINWFVKNFCNLLCSKIRDTNSKYCKPHCLNKDNEIKL